MKNLLFVFSLFAFAGCEKGEPTPTPTPKSVEPPTPATRSPAPAVESAREASRTPQTAAPADEARWRSSWNRFSASKDKTFEDDEYSFERARDGAVTAWRKTKAVAGSTKEKVADAAVEASVKSALAASPDVRASKIDVEVKDNVVHLEGKVASAAEAGEAIRVALGIPGVERVHSQIKY